MYFFMASTTILKFSNYLFKALDVQYHTFQRWRNRRNNSVGSKCVISLSTLMLITNMTSCSLHASLPPKCNIGKGCKLSNMTLSTQTLWGFTFHATPNIMGNSIYALGMVYGIAQKRNIKLNILINTCD